MNEFIWRFAGCFLLMIAGLSIVAGIVLLGWMFREWIERWRMRP